MHTQAWGMAAAATSSPQTANDNHTQRCHSIKNKTNQDGTMKNPSKPKANISQQTFEALKGLQHYADF